jgi:hypothetical protein
MGLMYFKKFRSQLRNYLTVIAALLKDIFLFKPLMMGKVLALSISGTTLQAFALGSTFFILKQLEKGPYVEIRKILSVIDARVHIIALFAGVFIVFGVAVILLYTAEKSAFTLSKKYVNNCGASVFEGFPLIVQRLEISAVNSKTGIPVALSSELRKPVRLEMGVRMLMRVPIFLFQILYGSIFLLYLEPWLTFILIITLIPLLIPLKRMTKDVKDSEKKRRQASASQRNEIGNLVWEMGRQPLISPQANANIQRMFDASPFAATNYYRFIRLVAQAGSRAIASTAWVITGLVCMFYFWIFYRSKGFPIALIVVYFGSLRMAVMSGRQIIARMAAFARFYVAVLEVFDDRAKAARMKEMSIEIQKFRIAGPDITQNGGKEAIVEGNGPFAVAGVFPLLPVNRYAVTVILPQLNDIKRAVVAKDMAVIHEDPDLNLYLNWRIFLGIDPAVKDGIFREKLKTCCHYLDSRAISLHLDKPMHEMWENKGWTQQEAVEAVLLRACFLSAPVVVIREEALDLLGHHAVENWKQILSDRLFLIYYQYDKQPVGRWGEIYMALINNEAKEPQGVVPVEWANANPDRILDTLKSRLDNGEEPLDDLEWDDEDEE